MPVSLTALARAGFSELSEAGLALERVCAVLGGQPEDVLEWVSAAADPDQALTALLALTDRSQPDVSKLWRDPDAAQRLLAALGASRGLLEFWLRHPDHLASLSEPLAQPQSEQEVRERLRAAVDAVLDGRSRPLSEHDEEHAWVVLRVAYRHELARLMAWDLQSEDALAVQPLVSATLAHLAAASLDAALIIARAAISLPDGQASRPGCFPSAQVSHTRLAIIGMGKSGAGELNVVSDVDVIYVGESADQEVVSTERAIEIATRLAQRVQRAIGAVAIEPALWEVDANLRPEGKSGALVRTLDSHVQYYARWAHSWEFQALLKARSMAGDLELGDAYVAAVAPFVWSSSERENFVESVQRMRERVTEHIPSDEVELQLKLGPGGLRDIEFTVQLLQLVHGKADPSVRQAGTLPALESLAAAGFVGRAEAAEFAADYRFLRVLEHRLQLARLRRTHLMPRDPEELRVLARASGLAGTAEELIERWHRVRNRVRGLHERLFYRPLLAAVAATDTDGFSLTNEQAAARLAAIGFRDPVGAIAHLSALSQGMSRRAAIQRALLPVLLQWLAQGADPDYGLLIFRRLSESLGEAPWFLRMMRDSAAAAQRLTSVLSGSRYIAELLDSIPEAVAWLEDDEDLRPRTAALLRDEATAVIARHADLEQAAEVLRFMRRREVLRLGIAAMLDVCDIDELAAGLTIVAEHHISSMLELIRDSEPDGFRFAVIGMGRFGGGELGIGSDVDVMYVYDAPESVTDAASRALTIVSELNRLSDDPRLPFDLDPGLRPEGKNGVVARTLEAYRAYYERWSLTWEAQALLRARFVAGDASLGAEFMDLADRIRYPVALSESDIREVRRIKARVESERLPQGADPNRHLKLGRGSLSDVEWFVQLIQLQHGHEVVALRTTSTLRALAEASRAGFVTATDAELLRSAWVFASRTRSAMTLWSRKTHDVLPSSRADLEGIARLMAYPPGSASQLEEDYLSVTRRARAVFEQGFYG